MLRICLFLSGLYIVANYITYGLFATRVFATSELIIWITIYFCVAYEKKYLRALSSSKKWNVLMVIFGFCANGAVVLLANSFLLSSDVSQKYPFLSMSLATWSNNCNPFFILATLALFNLARMSRFKSKFVNRLASLSLLIYIIHENILVRSYLRPFLVNWIYVHMGYDYIAVWVLLLAGIVFVCAAAAGLLYKHTLQKALHHVSDILYPVLQRTYIKIESGIMRLK